MQMLLSFNRIITQMPASSTLLLWKFPLDLPLSVQLAALQRDRNTLGLPEFHQDFCMRLLITTACGSALHRTRSRRGVTVPCVFAAKRTIWSHLLLKKEWCRKMNHEFMEKDYKGLMLLFINLSEFFKKQQREVSILLVYLAIVLGYSWADWKVEYCYFTKNWMLC